MIHAELDGPPMLRECHSGTKILGSSLTSQPISSSLLTQTVFPMPLMTPKLVQLIGWCHDEGQLVALILIFLGKGLLFYPGL